MKYFVACILLFTIFFIPVFSFAGLNTELLDASRKGNTSKVISLLEKGADVNVKDKKTGPTALICASRSGHIETVKALLKKGGDLSMRDNYGCQVHETALKSICSMFISVVQYNILKPSFDQNASDI